MYVSSHAATQKQPFVFNRMHFKTSVHIKWWVQFYGKIQTKQTNKSGQNAKK